MVFNKDSKAFRNTKKPTKLPKSAAAGAHPHIKMIPPPNDFLVGTSVPYASPETSTPVQPKGNGKRKSASKIPKSAGLNRSRDSTVIHTSPITIVQAVPSSLRRRNTPIINSSDSGSTIKGNIAEAAASDHFESPDLDLDLGLPLPLRHREPTVVANMSSPLSREGKGLPTTALSTSEPVAIKGTITSSTSPQLPSGQMASLIIPDTVPNSYDSYTSFKYTPPHGSPTPLPLQSDQKAKDSSPSCPVPKTSQLTPLLPAHRSSIRASRKSSRSTLPPGFYEYHTISGTVIIPRASERSESGSGSGYGSGSESGTGSTTSSSRSSLREKCRISCGMKPSLLCAYILCGCCLAWLMWMSWTTISPKETGNRGRVGSNGIGGHVLPSGAGVPAVTPFKHARTVKDLVPTTEAISPNFGVNTQVDRIDDITTIQVDKALNRHCDEENKREDIKNISIISRWFAIACAIVVAIMITIVLISDALYVPGGAKKIFSEKIFSEEV
ncbi:hypothetical protein OCU04_002371 [Sclerotinia nivalis]|uniref:Uncharacterized protein n=1 Tax=Sclerotinia nivalis TaxID=352851 RepID=A0A9X0DP01_9HELO|nr:hypothetical protein OCU04_002371 [Sclerotinia nivalis]